MPTLHAQWAIGLAVLGAILGSFIATVAIRGPEGRSAARGRSACDGCGRTLTAVELVPLLSWAVQRGRCRHCRAPIPRLHPVAELLAAAIGAGAGLVAQGWEGVAGAVFGWLLLALALLDWHAFWLPDALTAPLALTGLLAGVPPQWQDRVAGGVAGFASLWLVGAVYRRWRGRVGLGGGDPKLFGAIGLWLGWRPLPAVLVAACLFGLALVLAGRMRGDSVARDTALPLGTLLAAAAYPAWLLMIGLQP